MNYDYLINRFVIIELLKICLLRGYPFPYEERRGNGKLQLNSFNTFHGFHSLHTPNPQSHNTITTAILFHPQKTQQNTNQNLLPNPILFFRSPTQFLRPFRPPTRRNPRRLSLLFLFFFFFDSSEAQRDLIRNPPLDSMANPQRRALSLH